MLKKLNCFILSALMVISLWPSAIKVEAKPVNEQSKSYGNIPSDIKIGRQDSKFVKSINLPKKFDLREEGGVSSVKNQNPYGTCWSFATMASIESNTKYTTGKEVDLSEINLALDRLGVDKINNGGNFAMSASYFANWKGPVLEADNPYPVNGQTITPVNAPVAYHMQNSLLLPKRKDSYDNQYLKEAIIEKGAVAISYCHNDSYLAGDGKSYYYNGGTTTNHAVTIVGWDDDYPKEKFKNTPQGNGAFIVKNSWGTWFGEEGYFYISYYDTSLGQNLISVFQPLEQKDNYDNRYSYGNFNINYSANNSPVEYFTANKHKANNTEEIGAVSLYTFSTNVAYDIYIDENFNQANYPDNDASYLINNKKVQSGVFSYGGFNTVKLDKPIKVDSGKDFLVGIKFKDVYNAFIEFNNNDGQNNTFMIYGTKMNSIKYGANTLVTYSYNKSANDITAVTLDKSSLTMGLGNKANLKATVTGASTSNKEVIWSTSNSKIAVVDEDGVVTGKGAGQAVITAATRNGAIKSTAAITVNSQLAMVSSSNNIGAQEAAIITFNDIIKSSFDYSKITLKDKNGSLMPITTSIDYKRLAIKLNSKYIGQGRLHIPSNALANNVGKGLASDIDLDIMINNYSDTDPVNIGSPTIRKAVAKQIGKDENAITAGDLKQVTSLNIEEDNIDLKDIWMLTCLKDLNLNAKVSCVNVEDLKYLYSLDNLIFKNIKMINLNYIKNNKNITSIDVENGGLYSLEGIEKLSSLSGLSLVNNNIRDISSISALRNLEYVDLTNNKITDITPIKDCTSITNLILDDNNITSIDSVKGLLNLRELNIKGNRINNIKPIEALKNIITLYCDDNEISDITPLKTLSDNNVKAEVNISDNFVDPNDSIITYLRSTKGWKVVCNEKKNSFYELDNYKISNDKINSKRPITFTFSKGIKSVNYGKVQTENETLKYEIRGNKLIIHDEQIRSQSKPYIFYIDLNIIDEDGNEQAISRGINMSSVRSTYFSEDINKNGVIDIKDIAQLSKDYNLSAKGEAQWNFDEDLNLDGIIDIYDLSSVASQM